VSEVYPEMSERMRSEALAQGYRRSG